jgi:hypothetical protein
MQKTFIFFYQKLIYGVAWHVGLSGSVPPLIQEAAPPPF